jgi:hypothetical protein
MNALPECLASHIFVVLTLSYFQIPFSFTCFLYIQCSYNILYPTLALTGLCYNQFMQIVHLSKSTHTQVLQQTLLHCFLLSLHLPLKNASKLMKVIAQRKLSLHGLTDLLSKGSMQIYKQRENHYRKRLNFHMDINHVMITPCDMSPLNTSTGCTLIRFGLHSSLKIRHTMDLLFTSGYGPQNIAVSTSGRLSMCSQVKHQFAVAAKQFY